MNPEFTEKARKLIIQFRDEFLHGNINELKDFSFWKIAGNSKYDGTCTTWTLGKFDGDKTRIVYAIDYLLYVDEINQYVKEFYIPGYGKTYDWE